MEIKNIISAVEKNNQKVVLFFFIALLCTGLFIFKDYGISWDERYQWQSNGQVNYNFIVHGDKETLLNGADKYHGPAFELVLVVAEKVFGLMDVRDVFLMRHLMCFLTFYLSAIFFYFLSLRFFKSWKYALLGAVFYVMSPHVFSHAFYNSKDTVFLSFFTISIFFMFYFLEKRTIFRAVLFAVITAFTIDVRIVGVLIPVLFVYLSVLPLPPPEGDSLRRSILEKLKWIFVFFLILIPCIILFWPVLWIDPIFHFKEALKENSNYPWDQAVLYFGEQYKPTALPWHYLFFWMFVSRPLIYSLLFVTGLLAIGWNFISKPFIFLKEKSAEQTVVFWFFFPLLAIVIFKSPAFDTGRHLYFLHGAFVLISLFGVKALWQRIQKSNLFIWTFGGVLILSFSLLFINMAKLHPYEHLYYNETQTSDLQKHKANFEFDYWGQSSKEALDNLLKLDPSKEIYLQAENLPGELNAWMLMPEERSRIKFTKGMKGAKYFLADYRWKKDGEYPFKREAYSTMIGNAKAATIFKVWDSQELFTNKNTKKLIGLEHDFEIAKGGVADVNELFNLDLNVIEFELLGDNIVSIGALAYSGTHVTEVNETKEYSESLQLTDLSPIAGNKALIVKAAFWVYDVEPGSSSKLVISIETKEGKLCFWDAIVELKQETKPEHPGWKMITGAMEIPIIKNKDDRLKIYLMNTGKKRILMDDITIDFEELLKP